MKVLIVVESLTKGGRERRIIELLKGLKKYSDIECEVVIFRDLVEYEEFYTLNIPLHVLKRKTAKDLSIFFKFNRLINKIKPDIVHSWGGMSSIYSIPCARFHSIKTINAMITNSKADFLSENWVRSKLTFPFSNIVASNSNAGLKAYGAPAKKSVLIYNGFSPNRVKNLKPIEEIRNEIGINTPKAVAMIAAFLPRKDYITYINAAINVLKTRDDVTFLAIGEGSNRESMMNTVPGAFKEKIIFTGNRSDVESIVNAVDISVLTSSRKEHAEGISNVILESMALGKPVIATNDGGTPEIVQDNITGFLIPDGDVNALEEKINYLLNHPEIAQSMGEKGKKIVFESFTIDNMISTNYNLYKKLLTK
jgi:glycosyltransferase involved in cell wall biosynthesis